MKRYGTKKIRTKVEGHQNCGDCHPPQKSHRNRARQKGKAEIDEQLEEKTDQASAR